LICLTGERQGWVDRTLRASKPQIARRFAGRLVTIYGEDNTYLSLELHNPSDEATAREIASLGESLGLPPVAVQPVYCLSPQDAPRLKLLRAIDLNCPLDAVPKTALPNGGDPDVTLHWLSPD